MSNNQDNQLEPGTSISLESINQKHRNKQRLEAAKTKAKSLLKLNKSAGPGRDHLGRFSGNGLKSSRFGKPAILSALLIFAVVGGYFVYQTFAYTYASCNSSIIPYSYKYNLDCVTDSSEAKVVRLYYGIFNRAPDSGGLKYWSGKLESKSIPLAEVARQFMGSNEFKRKYGTLSNEAFVKAMYPQVFGRAPDSGGLKYWTDRLNKKTITRHALMVNFTESSEMKRNFAYTVAKDLGISDDLAGDKVATGSIECYGTVETKSDGSKWCSVNIKNNSAKNGNFWTTSIMNIPVSLANPAHWLEGQTDARLANSKGQSYGCGIETYRYTGKITSNTAFQDVRNSYGGGMGGCSPLTEGSNTAFIGNGFGLAPSTLNGLLVTVNANDSDYSKLPSNASVSVKMTGINLYAAGFSDLSYPNNQDVTVSSLAPSDSTKLSFQGKTYDLDYKLQYTTPNGSTGSIDWSQAATKKVAGKTSFYIDSSSSVDTSISSGYSLGFKVNVYNADTSALVPASSYKVYALKKLIMPSSQGVYSFNKPKGDEYFSGDDITVIMDSRFPSRLRYEIDIVSGPADYKIFQSSIGGGWPEYIK